MFLNRYIWGSVQDHTRCWYTKVTPSANTNRLAQITWFHEGFQPWLSLVCRGAKYREEDVDEISFGFWPCTWGMACTKRGYGHWHGPKAIWIGSLKDKKSWKHDKCYFDESNIYGCFYKACFSFIHITLFNLEGTCQSLQPLAPQPCNEVPKVSAYCRTYLPRMSCMVFVNTCMSCLEAFVGHYWDRWAMHKFKLAWQLPFSPPWWVVSIKWIGFE